MDRLAATAGGRTISEIARCAGWPFAPPRCYPSGRAVPRGGNARVAGKSTQELGFRQAGFKGSSNLRGMLSIGTFQATFHAVDKRVWTVQMDASACRRLRSRVVVAQSPHHLVCPEIQPADLHFLGATRGDPAWQSEWELMAVVLGVTAFSRYLRGKCVRLLTDNTGALSAVNNLRASAPGIADRRVGHQASPP